ncbi:Uu.00g048150.m01.CDS01 [Anthostomella pinea]|uniref:Uu.00g048150.m01.CDS01 n=1 Tax=Anthostomella pinea TaxID=933095 RepID=A0AAI8YEP0_9PEZI|nr:Uu.00g048150.m01.CDS01 [Anthostomella pinea]
MRNEFKIRPQTQDAAAGSNKNPNHKNAAKVFIHPSTFAQAGFTAGHICVLEADGGIRRDAVAWPLPDKNVANNIASISRVLKDTGGLEYNQMVRLFPGEAVPEAQVVVMRETTGPGATPLMASEQTRWEHHLAHKLEVAEYILPGIYFDDIVLEGVRRSYIVESVNGGTKGVAKYTHGCTTIDFFDNEAKEVGGKLRLGHIPALQPQMDQLNNFLDDYDVDFDGYTRPLFSCGIVIYGSHGTGKTMLLDRIAATNWGRVVRIGRKEKPATIQIHFKTALEQRTPTIVLIDDITELIGKDIANRTSFIDAIGDGLDALASRAREQNRRPNVFVVATCLDYLTDIPYNLQREGRFKTHIGLPIPDAQGRKEIIRSFAPTFPPDSFEQWISDLGDRTHAYTGADLGDVLCSATQAWKRRVPRRSKEEPLLWEDVRKGLQEVRPSAMHDIDLKPPTIRWSDIGGYEDVKAALQEVLQPRRDAQENLSDLTKGILLYGPPGCSKTMTAQAMATESGFNFFAVKGGEMLNMYVGETERSIRNLFKRAREASPSIIFFDEIDSIAGSRSGSGGATSGGGVQALTTLLNEMDGFEQIGDVFVLAATNKPDTLDPALIRPGRFDELIYVPLPDHKAREAIIANKAKKLAFTGDIDVTELARQTEGYSGAEVASICGKAFRGIRHDVRGSEMDILQAAIRRTPKRVSRDLLDHFRDWHEKFAQ